VNSARVRRILGPLVGAACLLWLFRSLSFDQFRHSVATIKWWWVAGAISAHIASYAAQGYRWKLLLARTGELSWFRSTEAIYAGLFVNELLPARPGELLRAFVVSRWLEVGVAEILPSVVVERVFDAIWMVFALALTLARVPMARRFLDREALLAGCGIAVAVVAVTAIVVRSTTNWFAHRLRESIAGPQVAQAFAVSGGFLLGQIAALWLVMQGCRIPLGPAAAMAVFVVIQLGTAIPNAPGNIGTYQLACVAGLTMFAVTRGAATAFSVVVFVILTVPVWLLGAVALIGVRSGSGEGQVSVRSVPDPVTSAITCRSRRRSNGFDSSATPSAREVSTSD